MTDMLRQGDVLLQRVPEIPSSADVPVPRVDGRVVLALGEAKGHAHAVVGEAELLATDLADPDGRYLRVLSPARVEHEEHDPLQLEPGLYRVRRQRVHTPRSPTMPKARPWVLAGD